MGINWGVALGSAANSGMNTYDRMQDNRLKQLQYAVQNNQYQDTLGLQQDLQQLDPNAPDYNQSVQAALARHGQPLQGAQYGRETSQTTGFNLANDKTKAIMDAGKQAHDFYNSVDGMVGQGNIAGAQKALLGQADQLGIKYQVSPDGSTLNLLGPDGKPSTQSYDLTHAPTLLAGAGALQNQILRSSLLAADPTLLPQMTQADAATTHANASMLDSQTRASVAPSEILRNRGAANQSNAEASIAPSRISALNAQAGAENARAGMEGAQTNMVNVNTDTLQAAGQLRDQINAMTPEQLASPEGQALTQKYLMYASPNGMAYARAYGGANTAAARAQSQGNRQHWTADPNNPNTYIDQSSGTVVQMGKGGQMKVTKLGQGLGGPGSKPSGSGVPMRADRTGRQLYQQADGQWNTDEQAALATYSPQQQQTAIRQPPPLPPPGYNPQGGQQAELPQGAPQGFDNPNY